MIYSGFLPEPTAILLVLFVAGWCAALVSYLLSKRLAGATILPDRPSLRSSHKVVTSRAGGMAIFTGWFLSMGALAVFLSVSESPNGLFAFATLCAGAFVLGAGDDRYGFAPIPKLIGQIVLAVVFTMLFGALDQAPVPFVGNVTLGVLGAPLTVFWIVAFMNAFNFMDGLNGIASVCAVFVASALGVAAGLGGQVDWAVASIMLAVAILGFAPVNMRGGRLFMGDSGSLFIGFAISSLAVLCATGSGGAISALFVPIAFMPFLVDVAFTIVHRTMRGQNVLSAHREHIYQLLNQLGRSHMSVTTSYAAAVAVSCAVAMMALTVPPAAQWIAPVLQAALLVVIALFVFYRAKSAGLLAAPEVSADEVGFGDLDAETDEFDDVIEDGLRAAE